MIKSILPPNHTALEKAVDVTIAKRLDYGLPLGNFHSAQECPAAFLPVLAWALSVDTWDSDWPESVKRNVIAASAFVHRNKGTRAALEAALGALDLDVSISEWFEHGGDPYTFRVEVMASARGINKAEIQMIEAVIARTKNARSWLEALRVILTAKPKRNVSVFAKSGIRMICVPPKPEAHISRNPYIVSTASIRVIAGVAA